MQRIFKHVFIVGGVGVGGGSLVYAAVLLEPKPVFYQDPAWAGMGIDWQAELLPYFQTAERMLGRTICPHQHTQDEWLKSTAEQMGVADTFAPIQLGIYFGPPEETRDPYFGGEGPSRRGCKLCGECLAGCAHNAKNSLDKNYLYLAQKKGAVILPLRKATFIQPVLGGYQVEMVHPLDKSQRYTPLQAPKVVLAGGVLGTLELLFRSRQAGMLPKLSARLGERVRTNSEAITAIVSKDMQIDLTCGPAISSDFHANELTHITQNRIPPCYWFMKLYASPLVDGAQPAWRGLKTLALFLLQPAGALAMLRTGANFHRRATLLTTMQNQDNEMSFTWQRSMLSGFQPALQSRLAGAARPPAFIREANEAARVFAQVSGGVAYNSSIESILNRSVTAHILGGCPIAADPEQGVIDSNHQVFGYPGLYVMDGSAIPANVGVNPSLTITALAERAMARW